MLEINGRWNDEGVGRNVIKGRDILLGEKARQNILDAVGQRMLHRCLPVEQVVKHLGDELVLIVMLDNIVAALPQVGTKVAGGGLQHRDNLGIGGIALVHRTFVLEDDEEAAADGVPGTEAGDKADVILMVRDNSRVFLAGFILPQLGQVGVDGGFLRHTFDLEFDRRDL